MATSKYKSSSSQRSGSSLPQEDDSTSRGTDRKFELESLDPGLEQDQKNVHCTPCQRRGKRATARYYCRDCQVGMCQFCMDHHVDDVKMNRHSVTTISTTYHVSPNQGPFPNLVEIGSIKFDVACCVRGSAFLPNGELAISDYTHSRIKVFSSDYMHKTIASMLVPKEHKTDPDRPKPLDITSVSDRGVAFTAKNGCVYIATIGSSMVMKVDRIITVISYESNYGECLGIAHNDADDNLYVGCGSDREGVYVKVYNMGGELLKTFLDNVSETPDFLTFGLNKSKLYAANSENVTVYDVHNFNVLESYPELQAQIRGLFVDKYGYLYTLALERRTFKSPGSLYRLNTDAGVTKVTTLDLRPSSVSYNTKTDVVAVTFEDSRYIFLYKLSLRTYQKVYENKLNKKISNH